MRVAIIGTGLSGLTAAIELAKRGVEVYVYYMRSQTHSNSYKLQAGIAMPLMYYDSPEIHVHDTINAGRYLNDIERVWFTVSKASEVYEFLRESGISFESVELEGGHSVPRTFSIKGLTGKYVVDKLYERARDIYVNFVKKGVTSLLVSDKMCLGLVDEDGEEHYYDAVIIASGGHTALYKYFSGSNDSLGLIIGDYLLHGGTAMDLEFVQFHPTTHISKGNVILISEALRGRGAKIIDGQGRRFTNELAPRDALSLEIYRKIINGEEVFLDIREVINLDKDFPHLYEMLRQAGIDPLKDVIPITPSAHYSIGGIRVDIYYRTELRNLYAIGEASATGMHGANRLAGNSALECIVSGLEVARTVIRDNTRLERRGVAISFHNPDIDPHELRELREIMWSYVGIIRRGDTLKKALASIKDLNLPKQLKELAKGIIKCAIAREESRGAHFREDYPFMRREFKLRSRYRKGVCTI